MKIEDRDLKANKKGYYTFECESMTLGNRQSLQKWDVKANLIAFLLK